MRIFLLFCATILLTVASCAFKTGIAPTDIAQKIANQLDLRQLAENLEERRIIFLAAKLEQGDVVAELDPTLDKSSTGFTVSTDGFLFVVDLEPLSRFAHRVIYVVTDKIGNIVELKLFEWPPTVNGVATLTGSIYEPTYSKIVWTNFHLTAMGGISFGEIVNRMEVPYGAIVVNGNDPTRLPDCDMSVDFTNMGQFFTMFYDEFRTRKLNYPTNTHQHLVDAIHDLTQRSLNFITIYIVTHGSIDRLVMGSEWINPTQLRDLMLSHPEVTFAIIIDACHSGSFINDLWVTVPNLVLITTATDLAHSSYGDLDEPNDPNPEDVGGEWSSGFLKGLLQNTVLGSWLNIEVEANTAGVVPEQILYHRAFQVAWENDCSRINGLSIPQYYGQYAP
ncbi:MAG: C13 family peptidase [Pseudothermotoga sp.]|nr:C13 family peptidase [Pseudothermotoga sp.]MDW8139238.1 C13 family peptidase [Pseudothermotoga sp.]